MGKKSNSGGQAQSSKPISVPNKEIIQRMNFLHQAAVLVSGALYTPTPSTSKVTQDAASLAQERQKQASTYKQAHDMVQKGQFISTQPGEDPTNRVAIQAETKAAVPASKRGPRKPEINNEFDKLRGKHIEEFLECWNEQGLTPEEIKVKLNKRKKSSRRRAAKVNMAPLYIGNTSFAPKEKDIFVSNHTEKRQKTNLPLHPSQIEHRNLACHYVNDIRTMARKNVLRMDPAIKRTMCRNCNALLIPGLTSKTKILPSPSHVHVMRTTCLACKVARTIPCPPIQEINEMMTLENLKSSEETSMQEDTTPMSTTTSTSHTLSEQSSNIENAPTPALQAETPAESVADAEGSMDLQSPPSGVEAGQDVTKRTKPKRKQKQQRKKRAADPIVPGTKGPYAPLRFHERPEHVITEINKPPTTSS